jgi:para-nitrobenzyl esterase
MKVAALMASPLAKGLFHRTICESGGSRDEMVTMDSLESFGEKFFEKLGVDKEKDPLKAARALAWEKIVEVDQAMNVEMGAQYVFMGVWTFVKDGYVQPDSTPNIFQAGKQNPVPFMLIANLGELTGPAFMPMAHMIPGYVKLLEGASKAGVKAYAGIFDQVPSNWRQEGGVSSHAMEMHYVFGQLDDKTAWHMLHYLYAKAGIKSAMPVITDADRKVSEAMMQIWTQFARTGNPSVKDLIYWPPWSKDTDKYLYIADPIVVKLGYSKVAQK